MGASAMSNKSVLFSVLLLAVLQYHRRLVTADELLNANTRDGVCNNAHDSSCVISNDERGDRIPEGCSLVMAPSGIEKSGWGVFTLAPLKKGQMVTNQGDIVIHIPDPNPHQAHEMRRLIWDYMWDGQEIHGHYEGLRVFSLNGGMGSLANSVSNRPNLAHGFPLADNAGVTRNDPGAGAITHYHNYSWTVSRDLDAGDEILVPYGTNWFKERGFDGNAMPQKVAVSHLRMNGYCIDNIAHGTSLIYGAGRGAFASRDLSKGAIVAPVPLIPLSRHSLEMIKEKQDGSIVKSTQLLQNYCFGHNDSSLLLYPYSHGINVINHDSVPNVKLRWWDGSMASFDKSFLELQQQSTSQLMFELVTTRLIKKGEEIVLDYGQGWGQAWKNHVDSWKPRDGDMNHVSAERLNRDDNFLILRTMQEQQTKPYPDDVFTSCYYQYTDYVKGFKDPSNASYNSVPSRSAALWKDDMIESRNLRPCVVLKREQPVTEGNEKAYNTHLYTVHVMNRPTIDEAERIPKGHMHFATHVPRHAIVFSDKTYTTDQHLEHAFRKEIGLGELFFEQWKDLLP